MPRKTASQRELLQEIEKLQARLDESQARADDTQTRLENTQARLEEVEDTLEAIHSGAIDAVVVSGSEGEKVFTLEGAERPYRILIESLNEGALTLLPDGTIAYSNGRFAEMVGTPLEEVIGSSIFRFLSAQQEASFRSLLQQTGSEQTKGSKAEFLLFASGGAVVPAQLSVSSLEEKETPGFCLVATDLSERKRAEEEIRQLNARLERRVADLVAANQELEAFSYSVSHDLRAPLRAMDGFSKALLEDYVDKLDAGAKTYIRHIRSATQRMDQLVDGILRLSRTSRTEMRRTRVDLSDLAQLILVELQRTAPKRQVDFEIAPGLVVNADEYLVRSVLENPLSNSWKFTSKHTCARIELGAAEQDGEKVFFVRDNGAGFDKAYSNKLFGAFQRLHTDKEFEGTGIGLAIVHRVIQRHGGRIWAEGEVEKGATFFFTLPPLPT